MKVAMLSPSFSSKKGSFEHEQPGLNGSRRKILLDKFLVGRGLGWVG